MASKTLTVAKSTSLNPYVELATIYKNNPMYNEEDYQYAVQGNFGENGVDMYLQALNASKDFNMDKFKADYSYDYADKYTRTQALFNEAFANKENVDAIRQRYVKNDKGQYILKNGEVAGPDADPSDYKIETYYQSDYDYYKQQIKEQNERNHVNFIYEQEQARKDDLNAAVKIGADIVSPVFEAGGAALGMVDSIKNFILGINNGLTASWQGKSFVDEFEKTLATGYRPSDEFVNWVTDFERRYTHIRDIDGEYTNVGRIIGGLATTLGQMLPSMAVGKAIGAALPSGTLLSEGVQFSPEVVRSIASSTSQTIFYMGVTTDFIREEHEYFALNGASVTSQQIVSNAILKSALQWAVEGVSDKMFGGSTIDRLVFGRGTARALASKSIAQTFVQDFVKEGLEEAMQDTTDFLVNKAYAWMVNENFAKYVEDNPITYQSLLDSYFMGGLASICGSGFSLLTTKRIVTGFKHDSNGNVVVDKRGNLIVDKLSKVESYRYGLNMESFFENFNQIIETSQDKALYTPAERAKLNTALAEAYASYRLIMSYYNEIGAERFNAANNLLKQIDAFVGDGVFDPGYSRRALNTMKTDLEALGIQVSKEMELDIEQAKMGTVVAMIEAGQEEEAAKNPIFKNALGIINKFKEVLAGSKKKLIVTKDGTNTVSTEEAYIVPKNMLESESAKTIFASLSENELVAKVKSLTGRFSLPLKNITEVYKKVSGLNDATQDDAIRSLLFDEDCVLYKALLRTANKDMIDLLTGISDLEHEIAVSNEADGVRKKQFNSIVNRMSIALTDYLCYQTNADYKLSILNDAQLTKIAQTRQSLTIAENVLKGNNLTKEDRQLIEDKIYYLNIVQSAKDDLKRKIYSTNIRERKNAIATLNKYYSDIFSTNYDGVTYMPQTSPANINFNAYLQSHNLTLKTLFENKLSQGTRKFITERYGKVTPTNIIRFRKEEYSAYSFDTYSIRLTDAGNVEVIDASTGSAVGFKYFDQSVNDIVSGNETIDRKSVIASNKRGDIIADLVKKDINDITARMMTLDDVIMDPNNLNDELRANIAAVYNGEVSPVTTFLYLRQYLAKNYEGVSITVLNDNTYSFANVKPMYDCFRSSGDINITNDTKVSDLVKKEYLTGTLKFIKIKLTKQRGVTATYNHKRNTIYVSEKIAAGKDKSFLKFIFAHEFQHAMQAQNRMNLGTNDRWLFNLGADLRKKIVEDIKKHKPELFREGLDKKQSEQVANDFVYFSTGESGAYGVDASTYVDFYPTIVQNTDSGTYIRLPWGSSYKITSEPISMFVRPDPLMQQEVDKLKQYLDTNGVEVTQDDAINDISNIENYYAYVITDENKIIKVEDMPNDLSTRGFIKIYSSYLPGENGNLDTYYVFNELSSYMTEDMYNTFDKILKEVYTNLKSNNINAQILFDTPGITKSIGTIYNPDSSNSNTATLREFMDIMAVYYGDELNFVPSLDDNFAKGNYEVKDVIEYVYKKIADPNSDIPMQTRSQYIKILNAITPQLDKTVAVSVVPTSTMESYHPKAQGLYSPAGPMAGVSYRADLSSDSDTRKTNVLLHELIHSITSKYIGAIEQTLKLKGIDIDNNFDITALATVSARTLYAENINTFKNLTVEQVNAFLNIVKLWALTKNNVGLNSEYGIKNPYEFIAELSNGTFVSKLTQISNVAKNLGTLIPAAYNINDVSTSANEILNIIAGAEKGVLTSERASYDYAGVLDEIPADSSYFKSYEQADEEVDEADEEKPLTKQARKKALTAAEADDEGRIYVSKSMAKGTNLEPLTQKYKRVQIDKRVAKFLVDSTGKNLDPAIVKLIKKGKIRTVADVYNYLRDHNDINDTTFKLINNTFFKNNEIKTMKELNDLVVKIPHFKALSRIAKNLGLTEEFVSSANPDAYQALVNIINDNEKLSTDFEKFVKQYETVETSLPYAKLIMLRHYDGTIASGAECASILKTIVTLGYKVTGQVRETSLTNTASTTKDGDEVTLEDTLADKDALADMYAFMEDSPLPAKVTKANMYFIKTMAKKFGTSEEVLNQIKEGIAIVSKIPPAVLDKLRVMQVISELTGKSLKELAENDSFVNTVSKMERPSSAIMNGIRSNVRSIKKFMQRGSKAEYNKAVKRFLNENKEYFDENLNLRPEITRNDIVRKYIDKDGKEVTKVIKRLQDTKALLDVAAKLADIKNAVKQGDYATQEQYEIRKSYLKTLAQFNKVSKTKIKTAQNIRTITTTIDEGVITFSGTKELPPFLAKILNYQFKKVVKNDVKFLSNEDDAHFKTNMKEFIHEFANELHGLTQEQVDDIVKFYTESIISEQGLTLSQYRSYYATQLYLSAYLIRAAEDGSFMFTLSDEQIDKLKRRLQEVPSMAGQILADWREASKQLDPMREMISAFKGDFKPREDDLEALDKAFKANDKEAIVKAKQDMYMHLVEEYGHNNPSIWNRILKYEQMAMLSGPGTWLRNWVSNHILFSEKNITIGNRTYRIGGLNTTAEGFSDLIFKIFPKAKKSSEWQYQITGTKVSDSAKNFIKTNLVESGILNELLAGGTKYQWAENKNLTASASLSALVARNLVNKLFYQTDTAEPALLNKAYDFISKMLSDDKSISKLAIRYIGQMLTEDSKAGKINLDEGITTDITRIISDGFTLAAQEHMHKANFWNTIEKELKYKYGDKAYFMFKQIFPFAASSWNWFIEGLRYTPVGLIASIRNYAKLESTIDAMERAKAEGKDIASSRFAEYLGRKNIGKGVIGSIGFMIGALLALTGHAKVVPGSNDEEYKLVVGNMYVDISNLIGNVGILSGMTFVGDIANKKNVLDIMANALTVMFNDNAVSDLYNTMRYSQSFGDLMIDMTTSKFNSFIPSFVKYLEIANPGKVKYGKGLNRLWQQMMVNTFPPLGNFLAHYVDPYTGKRQLQTNNVASEIFLKALNKSSPIKLYPFSVSAYEKADFELGQHHAMLSGNYTVNNTKVSLSMKEVQKLNEFYGELNAKDLDKLFNNKVTMKVQNANGTYSELKYSKMTDKQKAAAIDRIMSTNSDYAKIYALTNKGYKYYCSEEKRGELKKLGVTNVYVKVNNTEWR